MLDGYSKSNPPTWKMLPVEADVLNLLVEMGYKKGGSTQIQATGDLAMITSYYLLRIGECEREKEQYKNKTNRPVQTRGPKFFQEKQSRYSSVLTKQCPHLRDNDS